MLEEFAIDSWERAVSASVAQKATKSLERGRILFFPSLPFVCLPEEQRFLVEKNVDPKRKNISYDRSRDRMGGSLWEGEEGEKIKAMLKRFADASAKFAEHLFPHYHSHLACGRTSFRPIEIYGRASSTHKDDTRLHVDAFPSSPTQGKRILRFFANVNPHGEARVWRVGEPFEKVVKRFANNVPRQLPGSAQLLQLMRMTKSKRTAYDHYMLHIHDQMKEDTAYQQTVFQKEIVFPPGSSWIVFTDQVSHAAMRGRFVLEQTFSLPFERLQNVETAPLKVLEKHTRRPHLNQ